MIPEEEQWRPLARTMAESLNLDERLRRVFAETPRHSFVPVYYEREGSTHRAISSDDPRWLPGTYTDEALSTQIGDTALGPRPTSSSSQPSLMAAMLRALAVEEGMKVLELGTGSGYNAALLSSLAGEDHVVSIDIDPGLVAQARDRLAAVGLRPLLLAGDGAKGWPDGAPYDRVIATHAVERVPYPWVSQTRPGGVIVVDIRSVGAPQIGHLARLTVHGDGTASGHFRIPLPGYFMPDRTDLHRPHYRGPGGFDLREATGRRSELGARALQEPGFAFGLWARLPDLTLTSGPQSTLSTPDGSWAFVPDDPGEVQVAGPHDLWQVAEEQHAAWTSAGSPGMDAYTVTVTPEGQHITWE